jgi:hypothetical protein
VEKERTERLAPPPAQTAEPPLKQPYPEPTTPSRCVIWTPNDPTAPTAFLTKPDAVADLQAARQAGVSAEDRLRLFERSGGLWVEPGTKCRFIEVLPSGVAKVRLLEGVHAGVDGWIFLPRTQASAGQ